jgi:hypothetical protein
VVVEVIELSDDVARAAGFDQSGQTAKAASMLHKLGLNLYAQCISITNDRNWQDSVSPDHEEARFRIFLAGCAFMKVLGSQLEARVRIMRTLTDFIIAKERKFFLHTRLVDFLSVQAEGIDLHQGERWHPAIFLVKKGIAAQQALFQQESGLFTGMRQSRTCSSPPS